MVTGRGPGVGSAPVVACSQRHQRGSCPLLPMRDVGVHISSPVSSMCLRAKDHRTCGHRGVATRKTTGDLATRRGAGDPETRAGWNNGVTLRPPPVCTRRCGRWWTHGVGTVYNPCILVGLHVPLRAPPRWHPASPATRKLLNPGLCDAFSVARRACARTLTRRHVCYARKEASCSEVFNGSRKVQKLATGRRIARSQSDG